MTWNATDIISLAAVVGAAVALINYTNRVFLWLHRNARQDRKQNRRLTTTSEVRHTDDVLASSISFASL